MENWIPISEQPPLNRPVLVALQWFSSKKIVYAVLKRVEDDDCDYVTADDDSEISHSLRPLYWQRIVPIDNLLTKE